MRLLTILLTTVILSCSTTDKENLFDNLTDKETVIIYLSKYNLDSVPSEIGRLTNTKRLYITMDTVGWTIYPPLGGLPQPTDSGQSQKLPSEITKLTNLKTLALVRLRLNQLPDNFDQLKNLDSLDLMMNRLVIKDEIQKINGLKNLKYIQLFGNVVDSVDINELRKNNPGLVIKTWIE
jgi:Leucine-rich repeat (LRR) protein